MLKIGDKIYCYKYSRLVGCERIVKIAPKYAITNLGTKLNRKVEKNGSIKQINAEEFNNKDFFIETEELEDLYLKILIIAKISNFDFNKLDLQYLVKIFEIIETKQETMEG